MFTSVLRSAVGRLLRIVAGLGIALWGFDFALPEALFVQTLGVTMAIFAIANVCLLDSVGKWLQRRRKGRVRSGKWEVVTK